MATTISNLGFDCIFFLAFGLFTLIMGLMNKGGSFWNSFKYDGLKELLGKNYSRTINIIMGLISIIVGLAIYHKQNS